MFLNPLTDINETTAAVKTHIAGEKIFALSTLISKAKIILLDTSENKIMDMIVDNTALITNKINSLFVLPDDIFFIKKLPRYPLKDIRGS